MLHQVRGVRQGQVSTLCTWNRGPKTQLSSTTSAKELGPEDDATTTSAAEPITEGAERPERERGLATATEADRLGVGERPVGDPAPACARGDPHAESGCEVDVTNWTCA